MRLLGSAAGVFALALCGCVHIDDSGAETLTRASASDPLAGHARAVASARTFTELSNRFIEGFFAHNPDFAVISGRHEYDGQLPDWSDRGLAAQANFLRAAIEAAETLSVSGSEALSRDHLVLVAKDRLFKLTDQNAATNPDFYSWSLDPSVYITVPYAEPAERMSSFIAYARNIPAATEQIRSHLTGPIPKTFQYYGKAAYSGYAEFYRTDARAAFAAVRDDALQAQLIAATESAAKAMDALAAHVEGLDSVDGGFALGAERFHTMNMVGEGVDTPLAELEAIGRADLRRNQIALKTACASFAPGAGMGDCMLRMQGNKPVEGPVVEARKQLPDLRRFLVEKDLVSIPGTEQALVEESPPYNRQNSAYINIPGPYEKGLPSVYYISPPDPAWDEATRDAFVPAKADLLFTSVHEVWPGHFLQFLHSNRSQDLLARIFVTYGLAEGWAHYSEEMMWEAGLNDGDPETRIGMLSNALLRDCRYLSAIGLHTGKMTVAQSEELFRTECYQDLGTAKQQAARGTYDPRYLNYTMGKLMIRKLREDWTATRGGRAAWKQFHDRFLSYGGLPIPLIRRAMMKEETTHAQF